MLSPCLGLTPQLAGHLARMNEDQLSEFQDELKRIQRFNLSALKNAVDLCCASTSSENINTEDGQKLNDLALQNFNDQFKHFLDNGLVTQLLEEDAEIEQLILEGGISSTPQCLRLIANKMLPAKDKISQNYQIKSAETDKKVEILDELLNKECPEWIAKNADLVINLPEKCSEVTSLLRLLAVSDCAKDALKKKLVTLVIKSILESIADTSEDCLHDINRIYNADSKMFDVQFNDELKRYGVIQEPNSQQITNAAWESALSVIEDFTLKLEEVADDLEWSLRIGQQTSEEKNAINTGLFAKTFLVLSLAKLSPTNIPQIAELRKIASGPFLIKKYGASIGFKAARPIYQKWAQQLLVLKGGIDEQIYSLEKISEKLDELINVCQFDIYPEKKTTPKALAFIEKTQEIYRYTDQLIRLYSKCHEDFLRHIGSTANSSADKTLGQLIDHLKILPPESIRETHEKKGERLMLFITDNRQRAKLSPELKNAMDSHGGSY